MTIYLRFIKDKSVKKFEIKSIIKTVPLYVINLLITF